MAENILAVSVSGQLLVSINDFSKEKVLMDKLISNIEVAMAREKASLVLKNAFIVNVFNQTIDKGDIAINEDTIVGIGEYNSDCEMDCSGLYVAPGFIDAHVHIESSMVTPEIFSDLVIKRGVTTIIADPHEIANALGEEGIEFMLENSEKGIADTFFMLPSCVPAVDFEDNGAILGPDILAKFINNKKVLGLGEVMDVKAVTSGNSIIMEKIKVAANKRIDGHCPNVTKIELNAYLSSGIGTDHECLTPEEALNKVGLGMYIMLREGSAARDLVNILPAVNDSNYNRFLFCTDDRHIEDLVGEGSIDNCIRLAVTNGLEAIKAYTISSFNAASCYGLRDRGAIAPGLKADLVIFDDMKELRIKNVIKSGKIYNNKDNYSYINMKSSINLDYINENLFGVDVEGRGEIVNVIKAIPKSLETKKEKRKAIIKNGLICGVEGEDIVKIGVIERYKNTGKHGIGFIEGLGLRGCSIAQTIAHDSHNIIVVGDNDKDMEVAVNSIIRIGGGIVIVSKGELLEYLSLPIGGLMTTENPNAVLEKVVKLNMIARTYGVKKEFDPFLTLAFMALPVIPDFKITTRGLFDYKSFNFVDLFEVD